MVQKQKLNADIFCLLVAKEKAGELLFERIKLGEKMLSNSISDLSALKEHEANYFEWRTYNITLLNKIFDNKKIVNSHFSYPSIVSTLHISLKEKISQINNDIDWHIGQLKSTRNRISLYELKEEINTAKRNKVAPTSNNLVVKFFNTVKNNKIISVIIIISIFIIYLSSLTDAFSNLYNFVDSFISKDILENDSTDSNIKVDSTELNSFLVFPDKNQFDNWHQEVNFRLGLPKSPRNLATEEIEQKYLVKQYANWKKHPDSLDQRGLCGYNEHLPNDLIDKNAELKYKFIKASYSDIEEMGFIKDKPNIVDQEIFNFTISEISEFIKYTPPKTGRNWMTSPEYNFEFLMILFKREELRNKYLVDLGSIDNKSRISVYLDKEDFLCFRVIDENSKAYIIKLSHNLFDKKYQFNFKYGFHPDKSYMEIYINGIPIAIQHFNYKIPFYYYDNNVRVVGANLDGTYCGKLRMFFGNIYVKKDDKNIPLLTYDGSKLDAIYLSDEEIIVYEDQGEQLNFIRR